MLMETAKAEERDGRYLQDLTLDSLSSAPPVCPPSPHKLCEQAECVVVCVCGSGPEGYVAFRV